MFYDCAAIRKVSKYRYTAVFLNSAFNEARVSQLLKYSIDAQHVPWHLGVELTKIPPIAFTSLCTRFACVLFVLFCVLLYCLVHASVCISSSEALTSLTSSLQTFIKINPFDQLVTKTYPRLRRFNR